MLIWTEGGRVAAVSEPQALGYASAGIVLAVGDGAGDHFRVGDRVACAGAGVAIPAMLYARILKQVSSSVHPLINETGSFDFSGLVVVVGLLATLAYFYFGREHKGFIGRAAKVGTYFLMVFFGATFGYTVMSRISILIGRIDFLLTDFLHVLK
mgnify:CR=1 FL=1